MKNIKFIFTLLAILACSAAYAQQAKVEFKDDIKSNFDQGRAVISIATPVIERGEKFQLDVRFTSEGWGGTFFNVFLLNPGAGLPASLAMFDEKKNYLGNLLEWNGGSRRNMTPDDWFRVPSGAYVGTTVNQRAGLFGFRVEPLPAGTYYLQMIYNKSFTAPRPDNDEEMGRFYKEWDRSELFRSNVLKIELVDRKPTK